MKKLILFIKKNIITFLSILIISFLLSFMVVNNYNNKEYGGMFYGEISSTSRLSVNG